MTVVGSTGSRFLCYEQLIEMISKSYGYHTSEQVYEPGLEPVPNGLANVNSVW